MGIYGSPIHSPSFIYDKIKGFCKKNKKIISINDDKHSDVKIYTSYSMFKKTNKQQCENMLCTIIICDVPVLLNEISNLIFLDYENKNNTFNFLIKKFNTSILKKDILNQNPITYQIKKFDIISNIIENNVSGPFLDLFNNLIWDTPLAKRSFMKKTILNYLFNIINKDTFTENITFLSKKRGKGKELVLSIIKYLDTEAGKSLMNGLQFILKTNKTQFYTVSKKFHTNSSELRAFYASFIQMNKQTYSC